MSGSAKSDWAGRIEAAWPGLRSATAPLGDAGHRAWLVGPALIGCVRRPERAAPPHDDREADASGTPVRAATLWTDAPPESLAERFPSAVPGARPADPWLLPNGPAPLHLQPLGAPLETSLERMPFRALAVAVEVGGGSADGSRYGDPCDPVGGLDDVVHGRLRALGETAPAAARDPMLVLRAALLVAEHGLRPEAGLAAHLTPAVAALDGAPPVLLGAALLRVVLARDAEAGLDLLDASGLRSAWLGLERGSAVPAIGELPRDAAIRLLAWLGPTRAARLLHRVRLGVGIRERLVRLAEHHPLEARCPSARPRAVRRLLDRLGGPDFDALMALRRLELRCLGPVADTVGPSARLAALGETRAALDRSAAQPPALAVGGRALIDGLGLEAGPQIGRLLSLLEEEVAAGRVDNEPGALLERARAQALADPEGAQDASDA